MTGSGTFADPYLVTSVPYNSGLISPSSAFVGGGYNSTWWKFTLAATATIRIDAVPDPFATALILDLFNNAEAQIYDDVYVQQVLTLTGGESLTYRLATPTGVGGIGYRLYAVDDSTPELTLTVDDVTADTATLVWDPPTGAYLYVLYEVPDTYLDQYIESPVALTGLDSGIEHSWHIRPYGTSPFAPNGPPSNTVTFTMLGVGEVEAPPADADAQAMPLAEFIEIADPGADATAIAPPPSVVTVATFLYATPVAGAVVPAVRPMFVFGIVLAYGIDGLVQLQYDSDEAFGDPVTIEFVPYTTDGAPNNRILAVTDLADGEYWWRVRADDGNGWQAWYTYGPFTVDTSLGIGVMDGSLVVVATDPPAHLWFVRPTSGVVGDPVTLYGVGLVGAGTETVSINGINAPVQSQSTVAAGAAAYTSGRTVDSAEDGLVTVEHDEVVVLVPDGTDGGGPLFLQRG